MLRVQSELNIGHSVLKSFLIFYHCCNSLVA